VLVQMAGTDSVPIPQMTSCEASVEAGRSGLEVFRRRFGIQLRAWNELDGYLHLHWLIHTLGLRTSVCLLQGACII
jgi:hypothetical protein